MYELSVLPEFFCLILLLHLTFSFLPYLHFAFEPGLPESLCILKWCPNLQGLKCKVRAPCTSLSDNQTAILPAATLSHTTVCMMTWCCLHWFGEAGCWHTLTTICFLSDVSKANTAAWFPRQHTKEAVWPHMLEWCYTFSLCLYQHVCQDVHATVF